MKKNNLLLFVLLLLVNVGYGGVHSNIYVKVGEEDKLPLAQLSDLKAWESPVAIQYNVGGIPYMVLFDGDNRLLGFNVSLEQIIDLLKQAFDDK